MQLNIPTWLTLFRISIMPFFVLAFYLPFQWAPLSCALIFILAAATDWLDGFLARRWNQLTQFGAFLDPVADKIMIVTALILVAENFHCWWITLPTAIMIVREIMISALREWMANIGRGNTVSVSSIAKIKTTVQILALIALLWRPHIIISIIGVAALYISVILTFWSMLQYIYTAKLQFFKN